jgi:hypothetical protein
MRGERAEFTNYNGIVPRFSNGAHDLPLTGMSTFNPLDPAWATTSGTQQPQEQSGALKALCIRIVPNKDQPRAIHGDIDATKDYVDGIRCAFIATIEMQ